MSTFFRMAGLIGLLVSVLGIITILLMRKFRNNAIMRYIPTLIIWLVSIVFLVMAIFFAEPMQDLGYLVMAMITGIATFITLVITIVISKRQSRKNIKE